MIEQLGMDGVCYDCATKFGHGEPLTTLDKVRIFELPLNARLDDVVGGINERVALEQNRVRAWSAAFWAMPTDTFCTSTR